jgi:hypothetical protein
MTGQTKRRRPFGRSHAHGVAAAADSKRMSARRAVAGMSGMGRTLADAVGGFTWPELVALALMRAERDR